MSKLVRNQSQGYGYNYSSLADFHRADVSIPKMRTKATEYGEYIEYFDGENWQQGAKVVEMEMKGMNPAQAYGSALTYARRYTVAMAEAIATDDDESVEKDKSATAKPKASPSRPPSEAQITMIRTLCKKKGLDEASVNLRIAEIQTAAEASIAIGKLMGKTDESDS